MLNFLSSYKNYLLLNVKLNDEDVSNSTLEMLEDINGLEAAGIDTYIGGDNDGSGYYFDYNDQNKIVIKIYSLHNHMFW